MQNSNIFSARNVTLFVFILVVLFLGATFDVKLGPEAFLEGNNDYYCKTNPDAGNCKKPAQQ